MESKYQVINKIQISVEKRIANLEGRKRTLKLQLETLWPRDFYGVKCDVLYDQRVRDIDAELKDLRWYALYLHNAVEEREGTDGTHR